MNKLKIMIGLAVIATSLVATAAPGFAWFEATNGSSGENTVAPAGKALTALKFVMIGASVECEAAKVKIESWKIQEPTEKPGKVFAQKQVKAGPDEVAVLACSEAKGQLGGVKALINLEKCPVHVEQPSKGVKTAGHGAVIVECPISVPALHCTFKVPAGKEVTGENLGLQTIEQENSAGGNTLFKLAVAAIHYVTDCPGITTPGEAKLTGEIELLGQKVI